MLAQQLDAARWGLNRLTTVEPHDVREQLNLLGQEVAMSAVDLAVNGSGIEEQDGILPLRPALPLVEKPQGARQRDRVEHVRPDRDDDIDAAILDQLLPDKLLRAPRIPCRVCHDEACTPLIIQRRMKKLYPEVVGVIGPWDAMREAPVSLQLRLADT